MLYFIYGTSATRRHDARDALLKKNNLTHDRLVTKQARESSVAELEHVAGGASLFDEQLVVVFEYPFLDESFGELLLAHAHALVESRNHIFVVEREVTKDIVRSFEKAGAELFECNEPKEAKQKAFNIFSITNAFSARDKKETWLKYREAIAAEESPEAITGILFWSVKNMISKKYFSKWKREELEQVSRELVKLVHQAHAGAFDFEEELERFLLKRI